MCLLDYLVCLLDYWVCLLDHWVCLIDYWVSLRLLHTVRAGVSSSSDNLRTSVILSVAELICHKYLYVKEQDDTEVPLLSQEAHM